LTQADELAIYTTPPSPVELRKVLQVVQPKTIYIFGVLPLEEKPEEFINRLAGLCKFALNKREGKTTIQELASAMASREIAVEIGLQWLVANGGLTVNVDEGQVTLSDEKQEKNPYLQAELFTALKGILNEASAYRKYFATVADLKILFR